MRLVRHFLCLFMRMKHLFLFTFLWVAMYVTAQDTSANRNASKRLLYPVLWQQTAAEYRALCYQAYHSAAEQIAHLPRKMRRKKNLAIITDIDETVLDNSYFEAQLIKNNASYSDAFWKQWVSKSAATTVPGAVAFLQMAAKKRMQVFYVSNRDAGSEAATLINLKQYHFPNADTSHLLFKKEISSKESRRQSVMKNYNVVMLLGDNLADFSSLFEQQNIENRLAKTDKMKEEWGSKFIVLPNPMYGDWEGAFYQYQYNINEPQKEEILIKLLKGFIQ